MKTFDLKDELQLLKDRVDLLDLKNQDLEFKIAKKVVATLPEIPDYTGIIQDLEARLTARIS